MVETKIRKQKTSKYGEKTVVVRVPESMLPMVQEMLKQREVLETQWQEKLLGPSAQKLVNILVDILLTPKKALVKTLQEENTKHPDKAYIEYLSELEKQLNADRQRLTGVNAQLLIDYINDSEYES